MRNSTENFKILISLYSCHSQMAEIVATIIFYAEMSKWQWHYDLALDSLYFMATAWFRLYVFFHRAFGFPLFSPLFDPTTPYFTVLVYMAHPPAPPPPQPVHKGSLKSDPSEPMDSSSSSSRAPDDNYALADSGMANGFLLSEYV